MVNITQPTLSQKGIIRKQSVFYSFNVMFKDLAFCKDYNLFNNINQSVSLRYLTVKTNITMPMRSHGKDNTKEFVLLM